MCAGLGWQVGALTVGGCRVRARTETDGRAALSLLSFQLMSKVYNSAHVLALMSFRLLYLIFMYAIPKLGLRVEDGSSDNVGQILDG